MFYLEKDGKIQYSANDRQTLVNTLSFISGFKKSDIKETDREIVSTDEGLQFTDTEEYAYYKSKEDAIKEIEQLKTELQEEDYKIIKIMEANIQGQPLPYANTNELVSQRNLKRARINELEALFVKI